MLESLGVILIVLVALIGVGINAYKSLNGRGGCACVTGCDKPDDGSSCAGCPDQPKKNNRNSRYIEITVEDSNAQ